MKNIFALALLLVVLPAQAFTGPQQLIRETSDKVIDEIKTNANTYQSDPQKIYQLVDDLVLPHFDFAAMTDLALGRFKDEVSTAQKPAIVNEFRLLLVRTYSSALLEYTDQKLVYLPMEGSEADGEVTVRTEIEQAGGFPIPINYSLRLGNDGWKVFDISVDDVSLVTNYRSSFARAIKKDGVDGLIKTLQDRNQQQ
ncbi:MAG: ABC transporter substrate-binding protein [Gammaproteobacteria bacterium]|nr:ABC transporter substrate-binding protein [Gammaproteobacteria bacterium]MDH3447554.1 ABC transporter substrate-binding protein [Gammaproteobacteria bacterium]